MAVLYRWTEGQNDRMAEFTNEFVRRRVAVMATGGGSTWVAKAATTTIPIVFLIGEDPVKLGLVDNLARPGGNLTGINFLTRSWRQSGLSFCVSWRRRPLAWP